MSTRLMRSLSHAPLLLATACAARDGAPPRSLHTDSAGIDIVTSNGSNDLDWTFEPSFTIKTDETSGAGPFDANNEVVRADGSGRIIVLDYRGSRVLVFDPQGKFVRALGKRGGGPGEMAIGLALGVHPDGSIAVFDAAKHRLVRYGADGNILPEEDFRFGYFGGPFALTPAGYLFEGHGQNSAGVSVTSLARVTNGERSNMVEMVDAPTKPIELKTCGMSFSGMPPLFSPSLVWGAHGNTVAITTGAAYDIQVYDGARVLRRIRRPVTPRAASAALAAQEVGDNMQVGAEGGIRKCQTDEVVQQRGFAAEIPVVGAIKIAPNGDVWVQQRAVKGEVMPIDVFAANGDYIGSLKSAPFPAAFLPDGRMLTVTRDELDEATIVVYTVKKG